MPPRATGSERPVPAAALARAPRAGSLARAATFARATRVYWLGVFPQVARELRHWRTRAEAIPDPRLRELALRSLGERGNMEGAAAFATFAPRARRAAAVDATVAFQAAYNYLDILSEQPSQSPYENAAQLHEALLDALGAGGEADRPARRGGYYALHSHSDDGGYLQQLVGVCRDSFAALPSRAAAAPAARRAARRVVRFQAHQARRETGAAGEDGAIARWAAELTPPGADLRWWETAAAAGSSLGVHAAIALAAETGVCPAEASALEGAYFPWIGALHSLLDHLVDAGEDARDGERNLVARYPSVEQAAARMGELTGRALQSARALRPARRHELVVAAMASFYLADPGARTAQALPVAQAVRERFGPLARGPLAVFGARATAERWRQAAVDSGRAGGVGRSHAPPHRGWLPTSSG